MPCYRWTAELVSNEALGSVGFNERVKVERSFAGVGMIEVADDRARESADKFEAEIRRLFPISEIKTILEKKTFRLRSFWEAWTKI